MVAEGLFAHKIGGEVRLRVAAAAGGNALPAVGLAHLGRFALGGGGLAGELGLVIRGGLHVEQRV